MFAPTATVERGPSEGARSGSTGAIWVYCQSLPFSSPLFLPTQYRRGVGRWSSTARIERPQVYRGAFASKEDRLPTPCPTLASPSPTPVQYVFPVTPWLSDSFGSFRDSAIGVIGAIEGPDLL